MPTVKLFSFFCHSLNENENSCMNVCYKQPVLSMICTSVLASVHQKGNKTNWFKLGTSGGFCEHGNELPNCKRRGGFQNEMSSYLLFKKHTGPWSHYVSDLLEFVLQVGKTVADIRLFAPRTARQNNFIASDIFDFTCLHITCPKYDSAILSLNANVEQSFYCFKIATDARRVSRLSAQSSDGVKESKKKERTGL